MGFLIDGRKAEIINVGNRFSDYGDFAEEHGYPDAVKRGRQTPRNGDTVKLITSGPHLTGYLGDTLWIVEASNGERHIFNEKGLHI